MPVTLRSLQEREDGIPTAQYVWSPAYVDAPILRDRDANANPADGLGSSATTPSTTRTTTSPPSPTPPARSPSATSTTPTEPQRS